MDIANLLNPQNSSVASSASATPQPTWSYAARPAHSETPASPLSDASSAAGSVHHVKEEPAPTVKPQVQRLPSISAPISNNVHTPTPQRAAVSKPAPVNNHASKSPHHVLSGEMGRREWAVVVQDILAYLSSTSNPSRSYYCDTVHLLPESFLKSETGYYCYPFKGRFLPTGSADGSVWRSSQGSIKTRSGLVKRYFYCPCTKVTRQVTWLDECERWCFVEYRMNAKTEVRNMDTIQFPSHLDFKSLVAASSGCFKPKQNSTTSSSNSNTITTNKKSNREDSTSHKRVKVDPKSQPYLQAPASQVEKAEYDPSTTLALLAATTTYHTDAASRYGQTLQAPGVVPQPPQGAAWGPAVMATPQYCRPAYAAPHPHMLAPPHGQPIYPSPVKPQLHHSLYNLAMLADPVVHSGHSSYLRY